MADTPTNPTMHGYVFRPKRGTEEAGACFRWKARRRKPSNPYIHGDAEAELHRSGETRMRFTDSVGTRPYGFQ
ncbi:hypothetical protein EJ892_11000 [Pseudomonas aeruginosa]|nr:hypothetical protein EJ892_11000 [Pseudomonas aeruginosa]